jgi:hypothetical protein
MELRRLIVNRGSGLLSLFVVMLLVIGAVFVMPSLKNVSARAVSEVTCNEEEPTGQDSWYWNRAIGSYTPGYVFSFSDEREQFLGYHIYTEQTQSTLAEALSATHSEARLRFTLSGPYAQNPVPFNLVLVCHRAESHHGALYTVTALYRIEYILTPEEQALIDETAEVLEERGFTIPPEGIVIGNF